MKHQWNIFLAAGAVLALLAPFARPAASPDDHLIVHEWGTFTALQDEHGHPIGGINTDDEPVPDFVHNLHGELVQNNSQLPPVYFKGWPRCDRDVLVRLETPVIYFHPPRGSGVTHLDVDVEFKGGWLTQFYPDAKATAPGLHDERAQFGVLNANTVGSLSWRDLAIGTGKGGPQTHDRVWTAPRDVEAADVTTRAGESERYLFYRGVGHINAPLQISREGHELAIRADWGEWVRHDPQFTVGPLWLVDVKPDGSCAVRSMKAIKVRQASRDPLGHMEADFEASDYRADNLAVVRRELKEALVREGLYSDEADGLLNTWEVSYFKRPGTRVFFMVPPIWTQHYLPLHISQSAYINRVMVGRIELVTPRQRQLLSQISQGPASNPRWLDESLQRMQANKEARYREDWYQQAYEGKRSLESMGFTMPADYRAYLDLGRFRNALVLDELKNHPTQELERFVKNYELGASR
jgi:hypothetical protein